MVQNILILRALKRHCSRARLAKSDAVSMTSSLQEQVVALLAGDEVIAWNYVPTEAASGAQSRQFV